MTKSLLFLVFISLGVFASAQQYSFLTQSQQYKVDQFGQNVGLDDPFINTIDQADNGYLLVGTGEGIGVFDGASFEMFYTSDHLADNFISSSYKDENGNIWYGHKQGGVSIYDGKSFDLVHPGGGINSKINDIARDENGLTWCAAQDFGLFCVDDDGKFEFFNDKFIDQLIYSLTITKGQYFFVGTDAGIEVYKYYMEDKILSKVQRISDIAEDQVSSVLELEDGRLVVATLSSGLYLVEKKDDVFVSSKLNFLNYDDDVIIRDLSFYDGKLWVSTLQTGLLRCEMESDGLLVIENYHANSGLRTNAINTMFIDREGVMWIGTYGEGLASKGDNLFTFYFKNPHGEFNVQDIIVNDTKIWLASYGALSVLDKHTLKLLESYGDSNGLPKDAISSLIFIEDTIMFIGTERNGLFRYEPQTKLFRHILLSGDDLSQAITCLAADENNIWIGTLNGVYKMNAHTEGIVSYGISSGLSHNSVGDVLITKKGGVFIGTRSAFLSKYNDGVFENIQLTPELEIVTVNMMMESEDGAIWISTSDKGIFRVKDSVINISVLNGLESNYCYGIQQDINGRVWVMHNGGLSRVDFNEGDYEVETYSSKYGVASRFLRASMCKWEEEMWFGTENGAVRYNALEDKQNMVPPITSFSSIIINDKEYGFDEDIKLPYGEYDIFIDFKGISLKKSERVSYQFVLEGHQSKWSENSVINLAKYHKVYDGEYTFKVKSYNADGIVGEAATIRISIAKPFWKEWWFYVVLGIVLVLIIVFIVKMRERRYIRYQKELEHQLALRTKEVVHQKEEIEEINKDLTDSINYAKRIQTAILPEEEEFNNLFPNSFVVYKPKDIVSGDFYWARKFDNLHLIVCADCTGHGVPGAFMSMIGMMLLYESCVLKKILDPGEILKDLDFNLKEVLRQNDDFESNKDGMDLSLCIIDTDANKMYTGGAMRPIYVYRQGIQHIIKGDRFSLGGTIVKNKVFTTKEFDLMKDDMVYLFSDGYADQFGGPYKRKMKVTGLNELLDQVCQLQVSAQAEEVDSFFESWKGEVAQMDDVLLIGLKY